MALIENNKIKAGEKLPSEFDLQNKYQASRDTIRKALLLLSQNGYIQKSQGKSSIVLDINRFNFPVSGLTSFKEIASDIKGKVETIVHTCECIEPDEEILYHKHGKFANLDSIYLSFALLSQFLLLYIQEFL